MIESYEKLSSIGFENVILILLLSLGLGVSYFKAKDYICERFGIETKRSLKEKKRDEEIERLKKDCEELSNSIDTIKENRIHDREQSFQIQKDLIDNFSQVTNTLADIKNDILEDKIERKRWNILNFADELRHNDGVADNERYNNVFRDYDDYERIIRDKGLSNGFVEESIKFIRFKYQEMLND